jgi:hypothetical protein
VGLSQRQLVGGSMTWHFWLKLRHLSDRRVRCMNDRKCNIVLNL